jgi:redox-sensitive bicupin YhaK (pirin superfamily)
MINVRKSSQRGYAHHGWLESFHTFSFADYYDSNFMGFENLRVINEDKIDPGMGFKTHRHHDMEIITYVIAGLLEHKDSMGTGSVIKPGEIQIMTAGSGVAHSEFNASSTEKLHLLQIWILPRTQGLLPRYEQKKIREAHNELNLIASPKGGNGSVAIHQDVYLYTATLEKDITVNHELANKHSAWLQVISGSLEVNSVMLSAGDGAAITAENNLGLMCNDATEFLLFDLF